MMDTRHNGSEHSSLSSSTRQYEQQSESSDDEEVSLINPFASAQHYSRVRHRGSCNASGHAPEYTSTLMPVHSIISPNHPSSLASKRNQSQQQQQRPPLHHMTPGTAGFLEIEEEPSSFVPGQDADLLGLADTTQIRTSSGLVLTHRQTPAAMPRSRPAFSDDHGRNPKNNNRTFMNAPGTRVNMNHSSGRAFEVETGYADPSFGNPHYTTMYSSSHSPRDLIQTRRLLSYVRLWNAAFCMFLLIGTGVIIHSIRHEQSGTAEENSKAKYKLDDSNGSAPQMEQVDSAQVSESESQSEITERIILLPLPNATKQQHRRMVAQPQALSPEQHERGIRQSLRELRQEFEEWVDKHNKVYHSEDEKERRFQIWHDNHHKTIEKNERHGPCKLTGQPVFGSTPFKDLTTEEFKSQYLTGYRGPHTDQLKNHIDGVGSPKHRRVYENMFVPDAQDRAETRRLAPWHPSIRERYLNTWETVSKKPYMASSGCSFYDVSCWLRWFMYTYGYGIGGTMEPKYDGDTYPEAIDWRDYGVITSVHSQGNCGACWAITAVETIESVYALKSGTLVDLAETEVIVCEDSCEMCNGGWPQNAYDFDMENNGLLAENSWSYDGDFLSSLTSAMDGQSEKYDANYVKEYQSSVCSSGSGTRYAKIRGYGYATDRCVCYTDGTGCNCDEQNELKALQNVATYGPATVCLEASTWADYAGGILTSDSGCSPKFLDMNHCVQAVGYAFIDTDATDEENGDNGGSGSHSGSKSGSRDDGHREGYWIIRNQWSQYWGYNGYIYVAMGENTCGVLNDMTQVYM